MKHSRNFFSLNVLPVAYTPDALAPQEWFRFLADIWPDDIEAQETRQEFFGYALTADTSPQRCC